MGIQKAIDFNTFFFLRKQNQDVAVNELDFMGEYFFRKDAPQTHFAWFQPRDLVFSSCCGLRFGGVVDFG